MGVQELLLQCTGKVAAAVQDGNVVHFGPVLQQPADLRHYPFRFLLLALSVEVNDGLALRLAGEKVLGNAVLIIGNDAVGYVQDARRAAVILVQDDGSVCGKVHENVRPGSAPLVDGLVRVAHDEQVPVLGAQPLDKVPIVQVAVLGLVHHNVVELRLPVLAGVREMVQDVFGDVHQVVKVQRVVFHLAAHVGREPGGAAHLVGHDAAG